jgi:trans-aconitate methyltransferase
MKGLPDAEVYEQELQFMPYRASWRRVLNHLSEHTPNDGSLVDLMCGPGYLLGRLAERRPDLALSGVDIDHRYVPFAREKYPGINFELADILTWEPQAPFDVVICTGALHHIPYEEQEAAIRRMASMVAPGGFALISDCYVDDFANETERRIAAAKLGHEYLRETIENGAPPEVIEATIEILWNDVMRREFKTSTAKRFPIFERVFDSVETIKTWPVFESGYGDYISILGKGE